MGQKISIKVIENIGKEILIKSGLSNQEASVVVEHLLEEELMGKSSHGFYRLPAIARSVKESSGTSSIKKEKKSLINTLVDGGNNLGLIVAQEACTESIELASANGLALVGATNYIGTTGAMGFFTRKIANEGLVGICFCNSEYAVAPWGGKDAILGTNPISIAIPTGKDPIVIDFSTSAKTYGELMLAVKEGRKVEKGIVLDSNGKPSTDPDDANNGCQLPMAEHKGYGLGLAVEILSGLFIGSKAGHKAVEGSDGMLFIVFKPDLFVSLADFLNNTDLLIDEIKNSELAAGSAEIRIPGENSAKTHKKSLEGGFITINDNVFEEINKLNK